MPTIELPQGTVRYQDVGSGPAVDILPPPLFSYLRLLPHVPGRIALLAKGMRRSKN